MQKKYLIGFIFSMLLSSMLMQNNFVCLAGDEVEDLRKQMADIEKKMELAKVRKKRRLKIEQNLARLNDRYIEAQDLLAFADRKVAKLKKEKNTLQSRLKKAKQQRGPVREALADMVDERAQLKKLVEQKNIQLDKLDAKITIQKQKIAQFKEIQTTSDKRSSLLESELSKGKEKVREAELVVLALEKEQEKEKNKLRSLKK